jgi:peptidoglycan/LPS O-acetylase OafA/YrhL
VTQTAPAHPATTSTPPTPSTTLTHRPALDGVRAVAVLGVLLYHGGVALPGGYLGVDVFFVLSGYLITSLLLTEWLRRGTIALGTFWFHRARRLLPALVLVLVTVAAYSAWLAPDIVRERLRGDSVATLAYAANWHFVVNGISYFERYATPTPLLHTWSLAIEEQFYLVWPLVLLLVLTTGSRSRWARRVLAVTAVGAVASVLLMAVLHEPGLDPSRIYYGTDTRAQALLIGAAGAVVAVRRGWWAPRGRDGTAERPSRDAPRLWFAAAGVAGALVVGSMFAAAPDSADWMYRGGFTVVALAALAVVVAAAAPVTNPVERMLSLAPLRALGVISYGVYLWHWPVYVMLTPGRTGLDDLPLLALRLGATLVVSSFSYVLVERAVRAWSPARPQRLPALWPWTPRTAGAVLGAAGLCLALAAWSTTPRGTTGVASSDDLAVAAPADPGTVPSPSPLPSGPPLSVWLLGDSVAYGLHTDHRPDSAYGITAGGLTRLGCNVAGGQIAMDGQAVPTFDFCAEWPQNWRDDIAEVRPDVAVLMPGNGELFDHVVEGTAYEFGTPEYRDFVESWIDEDLTVMRQSAAEVAVTTVPCYDKPDTGLDPTPTYVNDVERQRWVNDVIRGYVEDHPDVHLFDLRSAVCDGDTYLDVKDGVRLRSDGVHWTAPGADLVWRWLTGEAREAVAGGDAQG